MHPIFIFGFGRSGTTWLANIFDSSPDTRYSHEPDKLLRCSDLPAIITLEDTSPYHARLRAYANSLIKTRLLPTVNNKATFAKSYRSQPANLLRQGYFMLANLAAKATGDHLHPSVPDFCNTNSAVPVIKSVSSLGRLPALAHALPEAKFIFLLRHPAAIHASLTRGVKLGKMAPFELYDDQLDLDYAQRKFIGPIERSRMSAAEKVAWSWAIFNDFILKRCEELNNIQVLKYEDLCQAPLGTARSLFKFANLPWQQQSEQYLQESLSLEANEHGYHDVRRNPLETMDKWRIELASNEIELMESIAADSLPGKLYGF